MSVSRRQFLQSTALAAIGCAATSTLSWAGAKKSSGPASTAASTIINSSISRQAFESEIGSSFEVTAGTQSQPAWLTLAAVGDLPQLAPVNPASMAVPPPKSKGSATKITGFVLSFSGGPADGLAQGTYTFQNSALGKFSLFIVPTGPGSQSYIAVFNHLG